MMALENDAADNRSCKFEKLWYSRKCRRYGTVADKEKHSAFDQVKVETAADRKQTESIRPGKG